MGMAREPRPWPMVTQMVNLRLCKQPGLGGLAIYMGMGFMVGKLSLFLIFICKLVIASVKDVNTLPAAIIYFLEAAHFTHLNSTRLS